jgi:zinc protease
MHWKQKALPGMLALALIVGTGNIGSGAKPESEGTMSAAVETYTLPNGLTVITKPVPSVPVVSVYVWYRVGSRNEPAGKSGMAHFLEHMLFKGTARFPKGEIARRVGRTGGEQNAFTSYDYTAFYETLPAEYLELALDIESDRMKNSLLDPKELDSERTVVLSELEGNRNHPHTRLRDLVNAQTWLEHPYRLPVIGWRPEVERLSADDLRAFYQKYYCPGNATLVVVGDFKTDTVRASIEHWFGKVPGGSEFKFTPLPPETQQGERHVVLKDFGQTPMLRLQIHIPEAGREEQYPLSVLSEVLADGKTARLYKALVGTGLAAEVSGSTQEMIDPGVWIFNVTCQPGVDPAQVEAVMKKEFKKITEEPLTQREFQQAVNQTKAQLLYAQDSISDQAMIMGYYQTVARNWHLAEEYPGRVAAVTPAQIQATAAKFLSPDQMTFGYFLPVPGGQPHGAPGGPAADDRLSWLPRTSPLALADALPVLPGAPGAEAAGNSSACQRFLLPNGLVLLVQPNHSNPTVSLSGLVRAGVVSEPADKNGLAVLHASLLDRGTRQHTAEQLSAELEFHAVHMNFNAGYEELNFGGEALTEDLELLLSSLAETLQEPTFPAAELEKVRKEVLTSCRMAQDSSQSQAWQGLFQMAYPAGHPMLHSLVTAEPSLKKIRRQDLMAYQQKWIRPDTTLISLAGDVDASRVKALVEKLFAGWKAEGPKPDNAYQPMSPVKKSEFRLVEIPGKHESITLLGHEGILRKDPEYYDAFLANHILGGAGLSSRLMRTVRDRDGLTYSIYTQFRSSTNMRPWVLQFQSDPGKVKQAIETSQKEIHALQSGEVSEQEVDDSREELVGGLQLTLETNQGIAYLNREIEYQQLGAGYLQQYPAVIRSVTRARVLEAAKKWFHPDRTLAVSVGPPQVPGAPAGGSPGGQEGR